MQHIVNAQGLNMPKLGLGTWPMLGDECTRAVEQALELGYRHIDTAAAYNNEDAVGQALANTPTPREQIHVTTKVWWDQLQPDAMRHSMERSLKALRSEYVDLFMIHWPSTAWDLPRTLETLASFKEQGLLATSAWRIFRCRCCAKSSRNTPSLCPRSRSSTTSCSDKTPCSTMPANTIWH